MEGEEEDAAASRWTCEACGCHTNQTSDRNCTICGTSHAGPSVLRRVGAAGYAARAGWFARGLGGSSSSSARRAAAMAGIMGEELSLEDDDLWESVMHGVGEMGHDLEALAMDIGGNSSARSRLVETSRLRFLEAARAFSQANRDAQQTVDPEELLRAATANAASYQPHWANPTTLPGARSVRSANGIEVGDGVDRQNLAHLPVGAGEGRAIRADEPIPRGDSDSNAFASFRMPTVASNNHATASNQSDDSPRRRAFGFRVSFDHPTAAEVTGANMGGCYLVGVTTSSFTAYGEQNGLQQSAFFWGIEDGGQKYEGSRHSSSRTTQRRPPGAVGAAAYSVELEETEAPMNEHSVLFGAREVITCVCDLDCRTLTFWRDETLLGSLVTNLPRSGNLYPVAVPFNCGVTVAISGLDNDPLPLLRTFATDWRKVQQEKEEKIRKRLEKERATLIQGDRPTNKLRKVLEEIFAMYADTASSEVDEELSLNYTMASRLWYRCNLKLAYLDYILKAKVDKVPGLCVKDFLSLIEQVIKDDETEIQTKRPLPSGDFTSTVSSFEVGDKVELAEGFERYGDAVGGPLQVGDRGVVVELQRGPNGQKRSIRVFHSGRRWWYQPQAILSERSGLVESPGVWFLNGVLRSHGYDHTTLETLVGKSVTPTSWRVGDIVAPRSSSIDEAGKESETESVDPLVIGRVVVEAPGPSSSPLAPYSRHSGNVVVEFISREFADAVGITATGLSSGSPPAIETRKVQTSKLIHSTELHGSLRVRSAQGPLYAGGSDYEVKSVAVENTATCTLNSSKDSTVKLEPLAASVSEKILSDIEAVSRLDRSAIDSLTKECRKSSEALASLFSAGMPEAMMSAICVAERQMNSLEPRDDLSEKLTAVGDLANSISEQLFCDLRCTQEMDEMDTESIVSQPMSTHNLLLNERKLLSYGDRRSRSRDSLARSETETEEEREGESQGMVPSLQQRRNMLLSLVSRASRRNNAAAFLNDMAESDIDSLGQLAPPLVPVRGAPSFLFDSPDDILDYDARVMAFAEGQPNRHESPEIDDDQGSLPSLEACVVVDRKVSFLDSILRCYRDVSSSQFSGGLKQGGAAYAVFIRHLISCGILVDSVAWSQALVDGHSKKVQLTSLHRSSSMLRGVVDDEGTPLLLLAILLGCSVDMVSRLIAWGARVGAEAIQKAAMTNQPSTLSLLLQHTSYKEGVVDLALCSLDVCRVLSQTKSRQSGLEERMRDVARDFMVRMLSKLFEMGLSSRRMHTARIDKCSKAICEMLVGNVLLRAFQWGQKSGGDLSQAEQECGRETSDRTCRFSADDAESDMGLVSQGLLGSLPRSVFESFLFDKEGRVTSYLLLCEDYLCSKEIAEIAAGLSFLSILLTKFPRLRSCSEMKRFGVSEFVSNHNVLASHRIADILSKQLTVGLDVSASPGGKSDDIRIGQEQTFSASGGCVLCPKKHTAVLHITRHSSFRCDVCGCAVPKGEYIFGCRQCDYDECLRCTLKDEKRTLGVQIMIRELATDCARMLSDCDGVVEGEDDKNCEGVIVEAGASDELNELSIRLLQRDVFAAKDLAILLNESGRITIHEFLSVILPALHASLVCNPKGSDGALVHGGAMHRNKKARSSHSNTLDSPETRLDYCREALRYMIIDSVEETVKLSEVGAERLARSADTWIDLSDDEEDEARENDEDEGGKVDITYSASAAEILRRLHQILSFYESVQVFSTSSEKSSGPNVTPNSGDLQALTNPIELQISPSAYGVAEIVSPKIRSDIYAEPLIPFVDLQLQVLRTYKVNDPMYASFCRRLHLDDAIIIEKPKRSPTGPWRIARVVGFDEMTGAHRVRYASGWKRGQERAVLLIPEGSVNDFSCFRFCGSEANLLLAARQYYILFRKLSTPSPEENPAAHDPVISSGVDTDDPRNRIMQAIGSRVESNCGLDGSWNVYTLIGKDVACSGESTDGSRYVLVSDDGELHSGVSSDQIRAHGVIPQDESSRSRRAGRLSGEDRSGLFPFFGARQRPEYPRSDSGSVGSSSNKARALRRSWSALSLIDDMRPVDLKVSTDTKDVCGSELSAYLRFICQVDVGEFQFFTDASALEMPPFLCVLFSAHEKLPGVDLATSPDKSLVCALKDMYLKQNKWSEWPPKPACRLFFSVRVDSSDSALVVAHESMPIKVPGSDELTGDSGVAVNYSWPPRLENRSRKFSSRSLASDDESDMDLVTSICDGVDEICVQCMEVIKLLSECAEDRSSPNYRDVLNLPGFANAGLSKKLSEQLDDVLCGVGGALPEWCLVAPSFAPRVFSYESRRMLLERAAFGPSRSTLNQQEAKVNVGRFRQRMTSLRARAVELVGEAFSGGAEDPTALQLQADELYGMEEALATRVRAAFRAVKWQEHSLQVAKAAVRRDRLLIDAAAVMDSYTNDRSVRRRRLEVRFKGESGFDAASGDEAGVTRGFYADVAEALLSAESVASVCCSPSCAHVSPTVSLKKIKPTDIKEIDEEALKLPLWIPDMDSSSQVILPTPRADKRSGLGVFPRPLPHYHPQLGEVLRTFRFMGRLFAAAMRDGFMFPLPLSTAFLKLVQNGTDAIAWKEALISSDLPRPGFLGGEVYAADFYVCRALDRMDSADPPLSRHELKRRYEEIATDKMFARGALGKSYDCSFEEYFQDRTFVDPLDPAQDANAVPLCSKGHAKHVTIYNIREWVALAKCFMLHEGVIEQALAFRCGVEDFFSADYLRVFTPEELQRDVCGAGDNVDNWNEIAIRKLLKLDGGKGAAEALVAVASIGGEGGAALSRRFGPSSPTVAFLVKALVEVSPKQRRQFLSFVTSVPIVTPGQIEVVPILSPSGEFLPMRDPSCLPRANTCSRRLYLPRFETFESFSDVLWAVVREESKFKGFFEWRGN